MSKKQILPPKGQQRCETCALAGRFCALTAGRCVCAGWTPIKRIK